MATSSVATIFDRVGENGTHIIQARCPLPSASAGILLAASVVHPSSSMSFDHAAATAIYTRKTSPIMLAHVPAAFTAHFGQAPMLLLMIAYTVYGLWLLSTPVVG
jgi:hypothetical protein